jgi:hypothetical protein
VANPKTGNSSYRWMRKKGEVKGMRHVGEGFQLLDNGMAYPCRLFAGDPCDQRL